MDVEEQMFEPTPVMASDVLERQRTHVSLGKRLHEAAWNNQIGEVAIVIGMGVDVNYGEAGWTALHSAAGHANMDMVSLLVAHGANVNAQNAIGETPLHAAAYAKDKKVFEFLVKHGARVDTKDDEGRDAKCWEDERDASDLSDVFDALGVEAN